MGEPVIIEPTSVSTKKPKKPAKVNFDAEINRLCDLGALAKLTKRYSKSKAGPKRMRNGQSKKSDCEIIEELSSADNSDTDIKPSEKKPLPNNRDLAKEMVLATSDSDIEAVDADTEKKKKKKTEQQNNSSKKSSRSSKRNRDPDFMKVTLGETDSEEEDDKIKKKLAKAKKKCLDDGD